jgi:hypothetical protein
VWNASAWNSLIGNSTTRLRTGADVVRWIGSVGSIDEVAFADELQSTAALAYPSTFTEMSCITVLEAMAAGAAVLTTRLGVLRLWPASRRSETKEPVSPRTGDPSNVGLTLPHRDHVDHWQRSWDNSSSPVVTECADGRHLHEGAHQG